MTAGAGGADASGSGASGSDSDVAGSGLLRLYPRAWRQRYEAEMLDLLASRPARTWPDRLDLVRGALDAHLHPARRSPLPGLLAVAGGGTWTVAAVVIALQPVPLDWPGYLFDVLPLQVVALVLLAGAVVGCWLRAGDGAGWLGRVAIGVALAGHAGWLAGLVAILAGIDYGAITAILSAVALGGTSLVGLTLLRRDDVALGLLLAVTPWTIGPGWAGWLAAGWPWVLFGAGWTAVGFVLLADSDRDRETGLVA